MHNKINALPNPDNLPAIAQSDLNVILEKHVMFLRGQVGGQRLILKYKNLSDLNFHNHNLSQADFTGSMLVGADLSLGTYSCSCFFACDLRNADLSHANLTRADLRGSCLSGANLSGANLTDADMREGKIMQSGEGGELVNRKRTAGTGSKTVLVGARLHNTDMSGVRAPSADFTDADLSKTITRDANFNGASFKGANLNRTDFTGSNLTHANMQRAILSETRLDATEHYGMDQTGAITEKDIGKKIEHTGKTLSQHLKEHTIWVETVGKQGTRLDLTGYDLRDVQDLRYYHFTAIKAIEASFLNLDLSNLALQSAILDGSDFRDAILQNADLRGCSLKGCKFTRANLRGIQLCPLKFDRKGNNNKLQRVDLSGSDLRFAQLQNADLRDAILMGVDFSHADLSNADLRRADLTGATINHTIFKNVLLEGAIIDFEYI
ncbi:MAG: pentapeptide repeat-containing protein [Alphaproteobacteria bacterium]